MNLKIDGINCPYEKLNGRGVFINEMQIEIKY